MRNYKIIGSENNSVYFEYPDGSSVIFTNGSEYFQQFIQDVAEQGIGIVEGPDVVEPSYAELRAAEYPSYADQFDQIYHEGVDAWKASIQQIKDRYPKTITGGTTVASVPTWVQDAADNWTYNKQLREYVAAVEILASNPDEETRDAAQAVIDRTPNSIIDSINN